MMSGLSYNMCSMPFPVSSTRALSMCNTLLAHTSSAATATVLYKQRPLHRSLLRRSGRSCCSVAHRGARPSPEQQRAQCPVAGAQPARPLRRCCRSRSPWRAHTLHGAPGAAPPQMLSLRPRCTPPALPARKRRHPQIERHFAQRHCLCDHARV